MWKKLISGLPIAAIIAVLLNVFNSQYKKHDKPSSKLGVVEGEEFPDPKNGDIYYEYLDGKIIPISKFNGKTRQYEPLDLVITDSTINNIDPKLIRTAKDGQAEEQWMLGTEYFDGEKVRRDYGEAAKWWEKAAKQGHMWALLRLSECYLEGKGVALDRKKGVQTLCLIIDKSENAYLRAVAMFRLSHCYRDGFGVQKNFDECTKWLRKSAEMGFFPAQTELGNAYLNGHYKIPKDEEQGRLWLKRSEESKQAFVNVIYKETLSK